MAIVDQIRGKRVYFDTNVFIYIFEGSPEYQNIVKPIIELAELDEIAIYTNEITLGELLVSPFKNRQNSIADTYIQALNNPDFVTLTPTSQHIHVEAARVRAVNGMKYPDAVHIASAIDSDCDVFLTNDRKIRAVSGLKMVYCS